MPENSHLLKAASNATEETWRDIRALISDDSSLVQVLAELSTTADFLAAQLSYMKVTSQGEIYNLALQQGKIQGIRLAVDYFLNSDETPAPERPTSDVY